ncbi:MAG: response regulator transcription factor [Proteobacteria bacterium]|nr:MAG: response regulator transcription factor [Pseudomonadota bacterium]
MEKHIILIEDDGSLLELACQVLENEGYRVSALDSLTSIEELAEMQADLFVIDERLPSVSGHIICIMLHEQAATRHIPQLLISGSPMLTRYAELAEVNASLRKPFEIAELLGKITELLK